MSYSAPDKGYWAAAEMTKSTTVDGWCPVVSVPREKIVGHGMRDEVKRRKSPQPLPRPAVTEVLGGFTCSVVTCETCCARSFYTEPINCLRRVIPYEKERRGGRFFRCFRCFLKKIKGKKVALLLIRAWKRLSWHTSTSRRFPIIRRRFFTPVFPAPSPTASGGLGRERHPSRS